MKIATKPKNTQVETASVKVKIFYEITSLVVA